MILRGRRLAPALLLLAGAAVLLFGLVALERIFFRERDAAVSGLDVRRRALEQYARQAIAESLGGRLAAVERRIEDARHDPLVPAQELLLQIDDRLVLPRRFSHLPGSATPAVRLHEALRARRWPPAPQGSPLAERIELLRRLSDALARQDRTGIEETFRRFLGHRMLYVLPAAEDLPLTLAALEALSEKSHPRVELMRGLLRDGLSDGRGGEMQGMQRTLLERRGKLTELDFAFLAASIRSLSESFGVLHDDFDARTAESGEAAVAVPPDLREPALLDGGRWYVEPRPDGSVRGVAVSLPSLLAEVTGEMRRRGLLSDEGRLAFDPKGTLALTHAKVRVDSPLFSREAAEARQNQRVKAAWLTACGLLAALLAGLGSLWIRQERRYLDLKGDFVATVSHELRTPLTSVRLLAETLERRLAPGSEARDYPSRIVREVDRLAFLVENILSYGRISRGRVRAQLSDVNLGEVIEAVHAERSEGRDVELSIDGLSSMWLRGDPELIHLLFSNLYENACRYSSRRPVRISASAEARGGVTAVLFTDNGEGIPDGEEERVFLEFYRAASGEGTSRKGSGLGLAICRRILALHGGSIRVVKSGPEGTTIGMSFPRS